MKTKHTPPIYESMCIINQRFEQILRELGRLQKFDGFRDRPPIKSVRRAVRETRAGTMFEILEVLHEREEQEWMRLGCLHGDGEEPPGLNR